MGMELARVRVGGLPFGVRHIMGSHRDHYVRMARRDSIRSRAYQSTQHGSPSPSGSEATQRYSTPFEIWDTAKYSMCTLTTARPNILTWYSCGPTVYDSAHIGHASSFIRQDVIRRLLQHFNQDLTVVQVMGITDIDDKIIQKANQSGAEWKSISRQYEKEFIGELSRLGVMPPHIFTRVSQFIPQILEFVGKLVSTGYAYPVKDGSVYFDAQKYGKQVIFRHSQKEDEEDPSTEEINPGGKKSARDFALWKGAKPGEPYWESPWGTERKGRPGWHIECSVMASQIFGPGLDLHTGGKDLIFPHHENEETQCCAHFQSSQWTSHWLHMGHLHFKGDVKMSKSLGNTVTIAQFLEQYSPQLLRLMCIMSRYRKDVEYSPDIIETAERMIDKLQTYFSDSSAILKGQKPMRISEPDQHLWEKLECAKIQLNSTLVNDFDTPGALKIIMNLIADFYRHFECTSTDDSSVPGLKSSMTSFELVIATNIFVEDFLNLVGLFLNTTTLSSSSTSNSNSAEIQRVLDKLVDFRKTVRSYSLAMNESDKATRKEKIKDRKELMEACDAVRNGLLEDNHIEIKDHGVTSSWRLIEKK